MTTECYEGSFLFQALGRREVAERDRGRSVKLNDHDQLRHEPLLAVLVGKRDPTGEDRSRPRDQGKALRPPRGALAYKLETAAPPVGVDRASRARQRPFSSPSRSAKRSRVTTPISPSGNTGVADAPRPSISSRSLPGEKCRPGVCPRDPISLLGRPSEGTFDVQK
jgi:hypothetical protein